MSANKILYNFSYFFKHTVFYPIFNYFFENKLALQILSYFVFLLSLTIVLGFQISLILTLGILLHEHGHAWAARRCNVPVKGIYLIPFIGGVAVISKLVTSREKQCFILMMGPIVGLASAFLSLLAFLITDIAVFNTAAFIYALFNLFNLFPISILDGGQLVDNFIAVKGKIRLPLKRIVLYTSLALTLLLLWVTKSIVVFFLLFFVLYENYKFDPKTYLNNSIKPLYRVGFFKYVSLYALSIFVGVLIMLLTVIMALPV